MEYARQSGLETLRLRALPTIFIAFLATLFFSTFAEAISSEKAALTPRAGVLIPLYVYPSEKAWDPIFQVITTHPSLDFTIVINPSNGPGSTPLPQIDYMRGIARLNTFPNVRIIGYVALNYGKRTAEAAYADITKYASWKGQNPQLGIQGIFLDESPQVASTQNTTLVSDVKTKIRTTAGLASGALDKAPFIVMNPGSIPDDVFLGHTDRTVVFEDQYQTYVNRQSAKALAALPERDVLVLLMHSIPTDLPKGQLRLMVDELRELAGTLFLTDLNDGYYQSFSPYFKEYIDALV